MSGDGSAEGSSAYGPRIPRKVIVLGSLLIAGSLLVTYLALSAGVGIDDEPDTPAEAQCVRVVTDVLDAELSGRQRGALQDAIRRWGTDSDAAVIASQLYVGFGGRGLRAPTPSRTFIETETRQACRRRL